jgi:hypothetical protein
MTAQNDRDDPRGFDWQLDECSVSAMPLSLAVGKGCQTRPARMAIVGTHPSAIPHRLQFRRLCMLLAVVIVDASVTMCLRGVLLEARTAQWAVWKLPALLWIQGRFPGVTSSHQVALETCLDPFLIYALM